jgi:zinc protease
LTGWQTFGLRGRQKEFRRLNLLAEILSDRLREEIREKLGASYSPDARADGDEAFDLGYIAAISVGKPADTPKLVNISRDLAIDLARKGATADELERARKPVLAQLEKSLRDNGYWLGTVLAQCQENPQKLDLARGREADYQSITLKELNELAKKYFTSDNAVRVQILPKAE